MRLIDADAMIADSREDPIGRQLIAKYNLDGYIYGRPTVDAVPVVRCKDCEYAKQNPRKQSIHKYICTWHDMTVFEHYFCGSAVRKEE